MKILLPALVLLIANCDSKHSDNRSPTAGDHLPLLAPRAPALSLRLTLEGGARVGENVHFKVRIRNISDREVDGVLSLDGSDVGMRFPLFQTRLTGPDDKPVAVNSDRCGNCNGLRKADIIALKTGEEFDPLGDESFLGHVFLSGWVPAGEGKHRLSLAVDYSAADPAQWNGPDRLSSNGDIVRALLARVPRERMEATVEFDVTK